MTKTEPVALFAAIATIVVTVAALFNVVLDTSVVETVLVNVVILGTALVQRSKVTPVP